MTRMLFIGLMVLVLASCGDDSKSSGNFSTSGCSTCRIFVTASSYNGNLGGISGADQKCANDANNPNDGATFKALVVGGTRRACSNSYCSSGYEAQNWVLKANTEYINMSDSSTFVTTNANAVVEYPVFVNDEGKENKALDKVWTGLSSMGGGFVDSVKDWTTASDNCSNWTNENALGGIYGESFSNDYSAFSSMSDFCSGLNKLYCVEQ